MIVLNNSQKEQGVLDSESYYLHCTYYTFQIS